MQNQCTTAADAADEGSAPARGGLKLGELLVRQGTLTRQQVEHICDVQAASRRPFGDLAERLFGVSPHAVEDAWVEQYKRTSPAADLGELRIDEACLRRINRRQAWQFQVLPMSHDGEGHLQVATHADNLVRGLNFAARTFDEPVLMTLADRRELLAFLEKHYPAPAHFRAFAQTLGAR